MRQALCQSAGQLPPNRGGPNFPKDLSALLSFERVDLDFHFCWNRQGTNCSMPMSHS